MIRLNKKATAGTITAAALGVVLVGCSSSSTTTSASPTTSVVVTSLAQVCPSIIAAYSSMPTGSVSNDQIASFITTLNGLKAQIPPAEQGTINASISAYQQLKDATDQTAVDAAQANVKTADEALKAACGG